MKFFITFSTLILYFVIYGVLTERLIPSSRIILDKCFQNFYSNNCSEDFEKVISTVSNKWCCIKFIYNEENDDEALQNNTMISSGNGNENMTTNIMISRETSDGEKVIEAAADATEYSMLDETYSINSNEAIDDSSSSMYNESSIDFQLNGASDDNAETLHQNFDDIESNLNADEIENELRVTGMENEGKFESFNENDFGIDDKNENDEGIDEKFNENDFSEGEKVEEDDSIPKNLESSVVSDNIITELNEENQAAVENKEDKTLRYKEVSRRDPKEAKVITENQQFDSDNQPEINSENLNASGDGSLNFDENSENKSVDVDESNSLELSNDSQNAEQYQENQSQSNENSPENLEESNENKEMDENNELETQNFDESEINNQNGGNFEESINANGNNFDEFNTVELNINEEETFKESENGDSLQANGEFNDASMNDDEEITENSQENDNKKLEESNKNVESTNENPKIDNNSEQSENIEIIEDSDVNEDISAEFNNNFEEQLENSPESDANFMNFNNAQMEPYSDIFDDFDQNVNENDQNFNENDQSLNQSDEEPEDLSENSQGLNNNTENQNKMSMEMNNNSESDGEVNIQGAIQNDNEITKSPEAKTTNKAKFNKNSFPKRFSSTSNIHAQKPKNSQNLFTNKLTPILSLNKRPGFHNRRQNKIRT